MTDAHCAWNKVSTCTPSLPTKTPPHPQVRLREGVTPRNTLLASLPDHDLVAIRPYLERVVLRRRQVLHERNAEVAHVYFIERGTVSLLCRTVGRDSQEVGALGRDDLVGVSAILGTAVAPHRCVVQVPGEALRIRTEELRRAMANNQALRSLLLAHVQTILVQSEQLVVCHTFHGLRERLASALLLTLGRMDGDEIPLTHRSLSQALGVRRAGVTMALGDLEGSGIIQRGRGQVRVLDRQRLERAACECHQVIRSARRHVVCVPADSCEARSVGATEAASWLRAGHQATLCPSMPRHHEIGRRALS